MIKNNVSILHNPRCRKSREAVNWLTENDIPFTTIDYMSKKLEFDFLEDLLKKLEVQADKILRKNEGDYKEHIKGRQLTQSQLIQLMIDFPKLIERPIVIFDNEAVIARPLENLIVWAQKKIKNAN